MSSGVSVIGLVRNISSSMLVSVFCTGAEREERISFEPASQTTLCLVVARGETSRDATRRGLLNRGNDSRLLGFFFRHGHGHHRDAATDGDARADETRQRENGHGHVHSLTARHLDFSFVVCSSFSFLFVLSRRRASSRRSSVKPLKRVASRSQTSIHPYACLSVYPYDQEALDPTTRPQDSCVDAVPGSVRLCLSNGPSRRHPAGRTSRGRRIQFSRAHPHRVSRRPAGEPRARDA